MVGSVRILVIEDEPRILGFLARGLEAEGFAVDGARNGREGLKRAQRDTYDLVLLDLKQGEDGHLVRAGTLVLDIARREARLGQVTAQLSDREFRVLHHLVVHHGEVISRERLLSEVWGYHFDPGSNVVDVCIRRLRKKLGADAPIETVRHAGYRLTAA
jgi:DNA-binding response OmpR family regulator